MARNGPSRLQVCDLLESVRCHAPELPSLGNVRILEAQALEPGDRHRELFISERPRLSRIANRTDPEDLVPAASADLEKQTTTES
jgi:hypothetical protein